MLRVDNRVAIEASTKITESCVDVLYKCHAIMDLDAHELFLNDADTNRTASWQ